MKNYFLVLAFFVFGLAACKKDDCPVPTPPVDLTVTSWSGPSTVNGIDYNMIFSLVADGTLTGVFLPYYSYTGTWSKSPNSNIVYIYFVLDGNNWKGQGTYYAGINKILDGTLTQLSGGSFTGTFNVTKT